METRQTYARLEHLIEKEGGLAMSATHVQILIVPPAKLSTWIMPTWLALHDGAMVGTGRVPLKEKSLERIVFKVFPDVITRFLEPV